MVRALELSENPGFDSLVGQGVGQSLHPSESSLVRTCFCLTPPPAQDFADNKDEKNSNDNDVSTYP